MHSPGGAAPLESERVEAAGRALRGPAHPWRFKAVLALLGGWLQSQGDIRKGPELWAGGTKSQSTPCQPAEGPGARPFSVEPLPHCAAGMDALAQARAPGCLLAHNSVFSTRSHANEWLLLLLL